MTVNTQLNGELTLTIDGDAYSCQVINLKLKLPSKGKGAITRTACPDGVVAEPGDDETGSLTGDVFTDSTATGITWILADALDADDELPYVLTLWSDLANTIATIFTGTLKVSSLELDFTPGKNARHPLDLEIITAARSRPT